MRPYYDEDGIQIYHGDVFEIIEAASPVDAIITDPPYSSGGLFRGDRTGKSTVDKYVNTGTAAYRPEFAGDNRDQRGFLAWVSLWCGAARMKTAAAGNLLIFTDWRQLPTVTDAIQAGGWVWSGVGVWDKKEGRPHHNGFRACAEFVVHGRNGPGGNPTPDDAYLDGIATCPPPRGDARVHITEKPAGALQWLVPICPEGGTVLDPFMGSGSTLLAAKRLKRKAIGGDVDERWCEIAAERLRQRSLF